jgi:H+-transporting ATPase
MAEGLTRSAAEKLLREHGYNEVAEKRVHPILLFLKKFRGLSAGMLWLIIILSFFLHKNYDAYIVIGLLVFNAIIGFIQEYNAANAVEALKKKLQINVNVLRDNLWTSIPARELVPGDIVRIRTGDFIPADLKIIRDELSVNQAAITGESGDIEKHVGDLVYSGSTVTRGEATGICSLTGAGTYYGKTIELVKTAQPKPHINEVITKVVKWLLVIVASLLLTAFIISYFKGVHLIEILPLMLVLMLGAIPVALTAMFTVSMALGSRQLAKEGVLITHLNAPHDAASMDILLVDKTGTLTENKLSVAKLVADQGYTENDVLLLGAMASQKANNDSIDMAFLHAAKQNGIRDDSFEQNNFIPFTPKNRKTEATITAGNTAFRVIKGAFDTIALDCGLGEERKNAWMEKINLLAKEGFRTIAIAKSDASGRYAFVGIAALHDPPRQDSAKLIDEIKTMGVSVKMLTGDALPVAVEIAEEVHIGHHLVKASALQDSDISTLLEQNNGVAEVYPEDKFRIAKALQSKGHIIGMTGDGVNDAPALKQAEVGIAVKNATDVAKSSASIVLTEEGLANILMPVRIGRMMFERINIWILNKFARTMLKTGFIVIVFLLLNKYVIRASSMLIIIFMTDFVKLSLSTDHVRWSLSPARWHIRKLALAGTILGVLMIAEAIGLLYIGLHYFGLLTDDAAINTFCFELLLFFALFSIIVVREKKHFWNSRPSNTVIFVILGDMLLGVMICTFGLLNFKALPFTQTLFVIAYALIFSFVINDVVKVYLLQKLS